MTRSAESAAQACVALWVVHTVELAAYGRRVLSGPMTPDGEPSPADGVESALLHTQAADMTRRLYERAQRLGLSDLEVSAGFDFCADKVQWADMRQHYNNALGLIGGRLGGT